MKLLRKVKTCSIQGHGVKTIISGHAIEQPVFQFDDNVFQQHKEQRMYTNPDPARVSSSKPKRYKRETLITDQPSHRRQYSQNNTDYSKKMNANRFLSSLGNKEYIGEGLEQMRVVTSRNQPTKQIISSSRGLQNYQTSRRLYKTTKEGELQDQCVSNQAVFNQSNKMGALQNDPRTEKFFTPVNKSMQSSPPKMDTVCEVLRVTKRPRRQISSTECNSRVDLTHKRP